MKDSRAVEHCRRYIHTYETAFCGRDFSLAVGWKRCSGMQDDVTFDLSGHSQSSACCVAGQATGESQRPERILYLYSIL